MGKVVRKQSERGHDGGGGHFDEAAVAFAGGELGYLFHLRAIVAGVRVAHLLEYTGEGVVWLSIVSSAPGQQGNFSNEEMNARTAEHGGHQTAVLIDADGTVGHAYGARTTPHMFVINPDQEIVYNGAIDDRPSPDPATLDGATNYVSGALDAAMSGQAASPASTQPYGCTVKYGS